ncbi:zinc ABC transporter substrate-binding protein [Geminicoccaceae bacterium 1502E]|nr:zinc ABC transporter substrate-binding protein [Geminicoccaceae bacterium 1502E]
MRAGWTRRAWLGMALAAGLAAPVAPEAAEPLSAVATIGMVGDVVRNVGGERVEVTTLMGEGVDPHLYKTTRTDIARMLQADIVFYNGLMLEGKMTDALVRVAGAGRRVHAVTELLPENFLLEPPEFAGAFDPHVWMDPTAWTRSVEVIRDKLVEADPEGAEAYRASAEAYAGELQRLDAYAEKVLESVPEERRVLVTAHDAFNYFGRRYGFRVEGIQGLSTDSEAGLRRIEELVDLLVELEIPAVFIESTIPVQTVQALVAGAAARGHEVVIGGSLFSDAMGAPGSYEGTYVGMIDHNVTVIARALGGSTPERGLNGQLAMRE